MKHVKFGAAALAVASMMTIPTVSSAATVSPPSLEPVQEASRATTEVRWRKHRYQRHHGRHGHWHHRHNRHRYGRDLAIGLGLGILGAATAPRAYGYYGDARGRCAARFRSFEWDTGLYTTYGGDKRLCPYLR
jgi:hypothetical protein